MSELILYSYWRSSCSYRVRIALNLKELEYEYREVHLIRDGGEQRKPDYLALNPKGEVPCLIHRGKPLSQSMAIIEYLQKAFSYKLSLFPANPWEGARVRQLCEMVNAGIQPMQNLSVLQELDQRFQTGAEGQADWARHWIDRGLQALESAVKITGGRYCFGDEISAADLFLVPQIYNALRYNLDLNAYPTLKRINETCLALEAFQRAEPSRQPDAPAQA